MRKTEEEDDEISEFEVEFGDGILGLTLETDFFHQNVIIKRIAPNSLAARHKRLKQGLVLVAINGTNVENMGYDITLSKIQEAAKYRSDARTMAITFRKASVHYRKLAQATAPETNETDSKPVVNQRRRSFSTHSTPRPESIDSIREKAIKLERKHSIDVEAFDSTIASLNKKLRAERSLNQRCKEKIKVLVCNQQLLSAGAVQQAPDGHVIFALRLLAAAFVMSAASVILPERTLFLEYIPRGFAVDEWFSVIVAAMLTYAHFYLAMCQGQDRGGWTSYQGLIFVMLLFLLNEGHGVYLATSALDESQRDMLAGLRHSDHVKFVVCAQKGGDITQSCRSDMLTWPLVYFLRENFSNYMFYGSNLALMYFSLYLETSHMDINSRVVRNLSKDLKFTICILHGVSLAAMALSDNVVPLTFIFCLMVLKQSKLRINTNQLVLNYLTRVSIVCIGILLTWYFTS